MTSIKSILWVQNEDASKFAHLIINGNKVSSQDTESYRLANKRILRVFPLSCFDKTVVLDYSKELNNRHFQLGSNLFGGVIYKSCFKEKSEDGTSQPFLFWKSNFQLKRFVNDAKISASALAKTLDEKELKFVENYIRRIRIRRIAFCVIIMVIALIIILLTTYCDNTLPPFDDGYNFINDSLK